ncbi:hypothetical protein VNO80_07024 [Phaseolus coccineus]|uniref:RIN4 pathogenic type III effector avirulence factor Avr cleavage site domain-containing protein n=1 Tax=Phaseolus coccineus TaxID=3886 RepID=A0AAN9RJ82_PHACN
MATQRIGRQNNLRDLVALASCHKIQNLKPLTLRSSLPISIEFKHQTVLVSSKSNSLIGVVHKTFLSKLPSWSFHSVERLVGFSQLSPFQALIQRKISTFFSNSSLPLLGILFPKLSKKQEMAQSSHDLKFGNGENEENVSDTAYSDKAQKPGSKMINPNEPKENSYPVSSADRPHSKPRVHSEDPFGKGSGIGSTDNSRKPSRQTIGSERNFDRSPLHRQAKTPGRDSPSWEVKNSYDTSHGTPGRSRLRPSNRGDETPDKGAAVPKFGDWDESNPASADNYTHIFNRVREEKQVGAGHVPGTPNARQYGVRNHPADEKAQSCCFYWGKK